MTPQVYQTFEAICAREGIQGPVLEVGAVPGADSLLRMECVRHIREKIGINLSSASGEGYDILACNANNMDCFENEAFQTVLCNATLEHDPFFWKSLAEIHRVTARGGLIVLGVPGFSGMGPGTFFPRKTLAARLCRQLAKITRSNVLLAGTVTLGEHPYPGDYYRFSEQAICEIFLQGLERINVRKVMNPPRFIGWGRKP